MISKHIECEPGNDSYRALANYICTASEQDKVLDSWFAGCVTEDNYHMAILEATATQAMNTSSKKEKTYHLLVSFRSEDADKLSPELFKEIETRFALVLGLQEHQRHCGIHQNTDNLHLHVAYNLIHPVSHKRVEPFRDYWKRDKLCRELEREYGLAVDKGIEQKRDSRLSDRAASMEAFSGQQSFAGYCLERRDAILIEMSSVTHWQQVHKILAKHGIAIKPHGNGLVLQALDKPRLNIKASSFDKNFSKSKLEARFGSYRTPVILRPQVRENYQARPLNSSPLFAEYVKLRDEKRALAASIREEKQRLLQENKNHWQTKRAEINFMPLTKRDKFGLIAGIYQQEKEHRQKIFKQAQRKHAALNSRFPYKSWKEFYRHNKHRELLMQKPQEQQVQQTMHKPIQLQSSQGISR